MKMAPLMRALAARAELPRAVLVHTGQHYDVAMNDRLFADLELPPPDVNLEVGSGTHAVQTADDHAAASSRCSMSSRRVASSSSGDVNSTLACSLVAVKKGMPVVHVEAGLRSFDRAMPEEINRILTDQISTLHFTTERTAAANLAREGIDPAGIRFVGNLMIDSLLQHRQRAIAPAATLARAGFPDCAGGRRGGYGVVTLHRPSNVDEPGALREALAILADVAQRLPLVWPVHPRARANIDRFGLGAVVAAARITLLAPQGYLEMVGLLGGARLVLTDSGGIQEETTALGVPCLTMRENTERPITVEQGTNTLVARDRRARWRASTTSSPPAASAAGCPELWDGHAAERIARDLSAWLGLSGTSLAAVNA